MPPSLSPAFVKVAACALLATAQTALAPHALGMVQSGSPTFHPSAARAVTTRSSINLVNDVNPSSKPIAYRMTVRPQTISDSQGNTYSAADGFQGGWYSGPILSRTDIKETVDDALYRPEWTAPRTWRKPLPNGTYDVTLKLREGYETAAGRRVFDVAAEGAPALVGLDIFAEKGLRTALDKTFRVGVNDGVLDLKFTARTGVAIVSAIVVTQVGGSSTQPPAPQASSGPPAPATAAGFRRMTFGDEFQSLDSIDLSGTGDPSKKWFTDRPFGWGKTDGLSVKNGELLIAPSTQSPNYGIGTSSPTSKAGRGFRYGYFEASIAFDPKNASTSEGFPSFWGVSHRAIVAGGKDRSSELDFFEAYHQAYSPYEHLYTGTIHDLLINPTFVDRANYGSNAVSLPGTNWNSFHTYGCLWLPGKITWYFDGKPMLSQSYSVNSVPSPNLENLPIGTFSEIDQDADGQTVVLGTGVGFPMRVDWVRVWQQ